MQIYLSKYNSTIQDKYIIIITHLDISGSKKGLNSSHLCCIGGIIVCSICSIIICGIIFSAFEGCSIRIYCWCCFSRCCFILLFFLLYITSLSSWFCWRSADSFQPSLSVL